MIRNIILLVLLFVCDCNSIIDAQAGTSKDTVSLDLRSADQMFLNNNLLLLAEKYNVDASKALILQAKLYPNPSFSYTNTIYNTCLLYTSDAADEEDSVDLGG